MSRRSARLQTKPVGKDSPPISVASSESSNAKPKPSRKKQRVAQKSETNDAPTTSDAAAAAADIKAPAIWARVRGRRGHLKMVVEMPFDILLEIFQYLGPADLLHLSRANHALRGMLLDRSTALPLWKAVSDLRLYNNLLVSDCGASPCMQAMTRAPEPQPPACPDDLSLPQYVNLLYGKTCFVSMKCQCFRISSDVRFV